MIRTFDEKQAKTLFRAYEDAITAEPQPRDFHLMEEPDTAGQKTLMFEKTPLQMSAGKVLGSIRVLEQGEFLISLLVLSLRKDGMFLAVKVSSFIDLGARNDVEFAGYLGKYIAEPDNVFPLSQDEVGRSVPLDEIDGYTLMQLEEVCRTGSTAVSFYRYQYGEMPTEWHIQFNIKEHELTLDFRSRDIARLGTPLWIPQLSSPQAQVMSADLCMDSMAFDKIQPGKQMLINLKRKKHEIITEMYKSVKWISNEKSDTDVKEDREVEKHIGQLLKEHISVVDEIEAHENIIEQPNYRLERDKGRIVLVPHPSFTGKRATVYCGEYPVFRGELPNKLLFSQNADTDVTDLEEMLQIRIEPA
jgi:hypothetical protein